MDFKIPPSPMVLFILKDFKDTLKMEEVVEKDGKLFCLITVQLPRTSDVQKCVSWKAGEICRTKVSVEMSEKVKN